MANGRLDGSAVGGPAVGKPEPIAVLVESVPALTSFGEPEPKAVLIETEPALTSFAQRRARFSSALPPLAGCTPWSPTTWSSRV